MHVKQKIQHQLQMIWKNLKLKGHMLIFTEGTKNNKSNCVSLDSGIYGQHHLTTCTQHIQ